MNMKGALEELVKALEELVKELVEDRRSQQHPVECGQDVNEEQAQLQEEMECQPDACRVIASAILAELDRKKFARN
jgi:hypothetical protein